MDRGPESVGSAYLAQVRFTLGQHGAKGKDTLIAALLLPNEEARIADELDYGARGCLDVSDNYLRKVIKKVEDLQRIMYVRGQLRVSKHVDERNEEPGLCG